MCKIKFIVMLFSLLISYPIFSITPDISEIGKVDIEITYKLASHGRIGYNTIFVMIPYSIDGLQIIDNIEYSIEPDKIVIKQGTKYAMFSINNNKNSTTEIHLLITARVLPGRNLPCPNGVEERYYKKEAFIESDCSEIVKTAMMLKDSNRIRTMFNIYNYVNKNIVYEENYESFISAKSTLLQKKGDCTESAELFIALMRACNLPARFVEGIFLGNRPKIHDAVEVYMPEYGWIRVEPLADENNFFPKYSNYIIFTRNLYDGFLNGIGLCRYSSLADENAYVDISMQYY